MLSFGTKLYRQMDNLTLLSRVHCLPYAMRIREWFVACRMGISGFFLHARMYLIYPDTGIGMHISDNNLAAVTKPYAFAISEDDKYTDVGKYRKINFLWIAGSANDEQVNCGNSQKGLKFLIFVCLCHLWIVRYHVCFWLFCLPCFMFQRGSKWRSSVCIFFNNWAVFPLLGESGLVCELGLSMLKVGFWELWVRLLWKTFVIWQVCQFNRNLP